MNSCTTYKAREFRDYQENNKDHLSTSMHLMASYKIYLIHKKIIIYVALYHNTGFYISDTIAIIALGNIKLIL